MFSVSRHFIPIPLPLPAYPVIQSGDYVKLSRIKSQMYKYLPIKKCIIFFVWKKNEPETLGHNSSKGFSKKVTLQAG